MPTFATSFLPRLALLLALLLPGAFRAAAQTGPGVGIGTTAPDASAALDIVSSAKGALLPRLTSAQRAAIAAPATGLLVFQTDAPAGFYYNAGTPGAPAWQQLATGVGPGDDLGNHTATQALNLQSNALTGSGASISGIGVGIRADGGLNLGQNNAGNSIYLGYQAGQANTTGSGNQFTGYQSGYSNTTGYQNQFTGYQSGYSNTTGYLNQFNGYQSGQANTTGYFNQFSGFFSGQYNTTGYQNQFTGAFSGLRNTTGINNLFSGYNSGVANTTGSNNTALGAFSGPAFGSALTNATALGANVTLTQSNTVVLGNGASVGIGTDTPTQKLEVAGTVYSTSGGFKFPDGTTQTTANRALTLTGQDLTLTGAGGTTVTLPANTGPAGATGPQGPQGAIGATGPQGVQGPAGPAGATGNTGPTGAPGPAGATGLQGVQGPAGPAGATGNTGPTGAPGPAGATGLQGPAGASGATGPQGPQGAIGATGPQGVQGPAGPAGATGNTGPTGAPGPAGATGAIGPQGAQGPAGTNGTNGTNGSNATAAAGPGLSSTVASGVTTVKLGGSALTAATDVPLAGNSLTFSGTGNVGIGTATPSQKLDVRGNLRLGDDGGAVTGTGNVIEFVGPGLNTDPVGLYRVNTASDASELRVVVGDNPDVNDRFSVGRTTTSTEGTLASGTFTPAFTVRADGNVGIGTNAPNASAVLDVSSTAKGLLPPRMTQAQRDAINPAAPAAGLLVYNTDTKALNQWDGTKWTELVGTGSGTPAAQNATTTFIFTGSSQTYPVPAGVTSILVTAVGGSGGGGAFSGSNRGLGASVQARLAVTPGEVLTVQVGGSGSRGIGFGNGGTGSGGYNGGGAGAGAGGGGGGATDLRRAGASTGDYLGARNALLVAAAGAGGNGGSGGNGGLPSPGSTGTGAAPGVGATQTGPGAGAGSGFGGIGQPGSAGTGGNAAGDTGGGGGGYYGGGGAGTASGFAAGGGGGSSWVMPGASAASYALGSLGNGSLTIAPDPVLAAPALSGANITGVIKNQTTQQTGANFNIDGNAVIGGNSTVAGKVGIGTASPAYALHLGDGTAPSSAHGLLQGVFGNASYLRHGRLMFNDANFGIGAGNMSNTAADADLYFYAYNGADRDIRFMHTDNALTDPSGAGWTTDLIIKQGGNVGIGTTAPVSRFSFGSTTTNANAAAGRLALYEATTGTNFYGLGLVLNGGGNYGMGLWGGSGSATPYNGSTGALPNLYLDQATSNVGIGTISPAARLDVNGNLRLAVRLCPVNQTAYTLTAADVAFSIFKLKIGNAVTTLTLPAVSAGQVEGQELTVINASDVNCTVSNANTDVNNTVTLTSANFNGVHAVKYVWATYDSGGGAWFRVQ